MTNYSWDDHDGGPDQPNTRRRFHRVRLCLWLWLSPELWQIRSMTLSWRIRKLVRCKCRR